MTLPLREYIAETPSAIATARKPKPNVLSWIRYSLNLKNIPTAAPKPAPLKTPRIEGLTSGLTNIA